MRQVVLSADAQLELRTAANWYSDREPGLGEEFVLEVDRTFSYYASLIESVQGLSLEDVQGALKQVLGEHAYREIVAGDLPE